MSLKNYLDNLKETPSTYNSRGMVNMTKYFKSNNASQYIIGAHGVMIEKNNNNNRFATFKVPDGKSIQVYAKCGDFLTVFSKNQLSKIGQQSIFNYFKKPNNDIFLFEAGDSAYDTEFTFPLIQLESQYTKYKTPESIFIRVMNLNRDTYMPHLNKMWNINYPMNINKDFCMYFRSYVINLFFFRESVRFRGFKMNVPLLGTYIDVKELLKQMNSFKIESLPIILQKGFDVLENTPKILTLQQLTSVVKKTSGNQQKFVTNLVFLFLFFMKYLELHTDKTMIGISNKLSNIIRELPPGHHHFISCRSCNINNRCYLRNEYKYSLRYKNQEGLVRRYRERIRILEKLNNEQMINKLSKELSMIENKAMKIKGFNRQLKRNFNNLQKQKLNMMKYPNPKLEQNNHAFSRNTR